MATRRRIPMVGDTPVVTVPVDNPKVEVDLQARREVSPSDEEFDWDAWSGLMIAALIVPRSTDHLVDYWKANVNLLDWAKKVKPDVFERIRAAFSARKLELQGGQDG